MPFKFNPCAPCCCVDPFIFDVTGDESDNVLIAADYLGGRAEFDPNDCSTNPHYPKTYLNTFGSSLIAYPQAARRDEVVLAAFSDMVIHTAWLANYPEEIPSNQTFNARFRFNGQTIEIPFANFASHTYGFSSNPFAGYACLNHPTFIARIHSDCSFEVLVGDQGACCTGMPGALFVTITMPFFAPTFVIELSYIPDANRWVGSETVISGGLPRTIEFYFECVVSVTGTKYHAHANIWSGSSVGELDEVCAYIPGVTMSATCSPAFSSEEVTVDVYEGQAPPCNGTTATFQVSE